MALFGRRRRRLLWRKSTPSQKDCHVKPALVDVSASTLDADGEDQIMIPRADENQESQFQPHQNQQRQRSTSTFAVGAGGRIRWPRLNKTQREVRREIVPKKKTTTTSNDGGVLWLFWSSSRRTTALAMILYGLLLGLSLRTTGGGRRAIFTYGIGFVVVYQLCRVMTPWYIYIFINDEEAQRSYRYLRYLYRIFHQETGRALSGHNYERQVVAAYLIHACTAPGESYLAFYIRHQMQYLNHQWIDELNHWSEKRLGYEQSRRNIFA
jgi:hypothetical protein